MSSKAVEFAKDNGARFVEELKALLRIPSISTTPERAGDVRKAAEFVAEGLRAAGMENIRLIETTTAVHQGHPLVYADWLQGLGLLMIIAHSGGYMTLYGHAEVLYKSVGDRVAPGDVIGALNDSEGANPQLYFEIREGRKTVDPKLWLKTGP